MYLTLSINYSIAEILITFTLGAVIAQDFLGQRLMVDDRLDVKSRLNVRN